MHRGQAGDGVRTRSRKRGARKGLGSIRGRKKGKGQAKRPGKHGAELRDQVGMGWS